jgi:urease accessory protein
MRHAHLVLRSGEWPIEECRGTLTLAYEERHRRRVRLTTDEGEDVLLDLSRATVLGDGDGLMLEEGGYVAVRAAAEDLVEVTAPTPELLTRVAWHIGNRHFPAEIHGDHLRIRDDHVLVDMITGLGGKVRRLRAPFNPEGGAYDSHGHSHDRDHHHDH